MSDDQQSRKEEILASAKSIMDAFFTKLSQTPIENETFGLKRETQMREPKQKEMQPQEVSFKEKILRNAPQKNQDYIIAEKKNW